MNKEIPIIQAKAITEYQHKKTGVIYKTKEEWQNLGISNEDIAQNVTIKMPPLDLLGKTS